MPRPNEWRGSGNVVRLGPFDALAGVPLILMIAHLRWWTFFLAVGCFFVFGVLGRLGFRPKVAVRRLRALAAGRIRHGKAWWQRPQQRL